MEPSNTTVMNYYLETIGAALSESGHDVSYAYRAEEIHPRSDDKIVAATATSAIKLFPKCRHLIYWAQGVWPEESYMRHKSKLRFLVTGILEKWVLKHAEFVFFVSNSMRTFYEEKYQLNFDGRCYIMPCANEELHQESFAAPDKYTRNVFCYAGSTSVWQCFEPTVALYRKIEEKYPDSKLLLLVSDRDTAMEYIQKYNVQNYEINFVPVEQLPQVLKEVKFGFVLREPSPVNSVATPTKILTYLANGILPIYSTCLDGIHEILQNTAYGVAYRNDGDLAQIERLMAEPPVGDAVLQEFQVIYKEHYARQTHIERIKQIFRNFS